MHRDPSVPGLPLMTPLSVILIIPFFLLISLPISIHAQQTPPPPPRGIYINCGATKGENIGGIPWTADEGFIKAGNVSKINTPGVTPHLSTLRYFPENTPGRKYCYSIPVAKGSKYLVRTTYYYGGYDGGITPPVFDQIIGGTKWSTVNTTENYAKGLTSYYEIVVGAASKAMSVCLARNKDTTSSPFISAIELAYLEDSLYNSTDFREFALATIARHTFGHDGQILSYPDDPYNRYWEPFKDDNPVVVSHSNVSSSDFWNLPPVAAFRSALTTSRGKSLVVQWPAIELPPTSYYIVLYFQDNRTPSPFSWRVFDVSLNGNNFITGVNVSTAGVMVYGTNWPLSGRTQITLTPAPTSPVGPVISAGEILQVVRIGGRTHTRDGNQSGVGNDPNSCSMLFCYHPLRDCIATVVAMEALASSLSNVPTDWRGDPCLPRELPWSGVTCSQGKLARVISLNLPGHGLSGTLPESIGNLTAIQSIYLGWNNLSGPIPDLSSLKDLVSLHLENNQLTGPIPPTLGHLESLKEIYVQNNHLHGPIPNILKKKSGLQIQTSPGNQIG